MQRNKKIFLLIISLIFFLVACNIGGLQERELTEPLETQRLEGTLEDGEIIPDSTTISSESTAIPSNKFPHTKAVQIQQAKYKFVVDTEKKQNVQFRIPGRQQGTTPETNQVEEQPDQVEPTPEATETLPNIQETVPNAQPTPEAQPEVTQEEPQATRDADRGEGQISTIEAKVIELTNQERRKNGLSDLQAHNSLSNVARTKSKDMQQNNYFSHTSPTYGSPFDMIRDFGISYNAAAENIAQGQRSAEQVVQSWMNSEGHRKNILNGNFTHIGVGYNENGHYWTQMFIRQ